MGTLPTAGRAEPQGQGCCQRPGAAAHQLRGSAGCGRWLARLRSAYARLEVREKPGALENALALHLFHWNLFVSGSEGLGFLCVVDVGAVVCAREYVLAACRPGSHRAWV